LAAKGYGYGHKLHTLRSVQRGNGELYAHVQLVDGVESTGFDFHPSLLDAGVQAWLLQGAFTEDQADDVMYVPFTWGGVTVHASDIRECWVKIQSDPSTKTIAMEFIDSCGQPVLSVESLTFIASSTPQPELPLSRVELPPVPVQHRASQRIATDVSETGSISKYLAEADTEKQSRIIERLVHENTAAVLGHEDSRGIDPGRAFKEIGVDSMTAVELRNRLRRATGLPLAPTVAFDYPTVTSLAEHMLTLLAGGRTRNPRDHRALEHLTFLEASLDELTADGPSLADAIARISRLLETYRNAERNFAGNNNTDSLTSSDADLLTATEDELYGILDEELNS
jgi:acyl carrier protein